MSSSSSFSALLVSKVSSLFGFWRKTALAPSSTDVEAQVDTGIHTNLAAPAPVHIHHPHQHSRSFSHSTSLAKEEERTDAVDNFFGVVRSSRRRSSTTYGTRDSRHDSVLPPPYASVSTSEPPAYTPDAEPPTLAKYFFLFGFVFPLFWLAGALILVSPLRAPDDWAVEKTEEEREVMIGEMRRTEVKWGRRCLVSLSMLVVAVAGVVVAIVISTR